MAASEERGFGSVRYGGRLSDKADYTFFGKVFQTQRLVNAAGIATPMMGNKHCAAVDAWIGS